MGGGGGGGRGGWLLFSWGLWAPRAKLWRRSMDELWVDRGTHSHVVGRNSVGPFHCGLNPHWPQHEDPGATVIGWVGGWGLGVGWGVGVWWRGGGLGRGGLEREGKPLWSHFRLSPWGEMDFSPTRQRSSSAQLQLRLGAVPGVSSEIGGKKKSWHENTGTENTCFWFSFGYKCILLFPVVLHILFSILLFAFWVYSTVCLGSQRCFYFSPAVANVFCMKYACICNNLMEILSPSEQQVVLTSKSFSDAIQTLRLPRLPPPHVLPHIT